MIYLRNGFYHSLSFRSNEYYDSLGYCNFLNLAVSKYEIPHGLCSEVTHLPVTLSAILNVCTLPTECVCELRMLLRTNSGGCNTA